MTGNFVRSKLITFHRKCKTPKVLGIDVDVVIGDRWFCLVLFGMGAASVRLQQAMIRRVELVYHITVYYIEIHLHCPQFNPFRSLLIREPVNPS